MYYSNRRNFAYGSTLRRNLHVINSTLRVFNTYDDNCALVKGKRSVKPPGLYPNYLNALCDDMATRFSLERSDVDDQSPSKWTQSTFAHIGLDSFFVEHIKIIIANLSFKVPVLRWLWIRTRSTAANWYLLWKIKWDWCWHCYVWVDISRIELIAIATVPGNLRIPLYC